jgi:hypothetical protein
MSSLQGMGNEDIILGECLINSGCIAHLKAGMDFLAG